MNENKMQQILVHDDDVYCMNFVDIIMLYMNPLIENSACTIYSTAPGDRKVYIYIYIEI